MARVSAWYGESGSSSGASAARNMSLMCSRAKLGSHRCNARARIVRAAVFRVNEDVFTRASERPDKGAKVPSGKKRARATARRSSSVTSARWTVPPRRVRRSCNSSNDSARLAWNVMRRRSCGGIAASSVSARCRFAGFVVSSSMQISSNSDSSMTSTTLVSE
eukprot:Amastigsp_a3041_38.p3 type:complete len:163 gc:universal Amastigsp_a3041_38:1051-1539(+)